MSYLLVVGVVAGWLGLGLLGSGFSYAFFQRGFPGLSKKDRTFDTVKDLGMSIFGLCNLLGVLIFLFVEGCYLKYGWLFPGTVDPTLPESFDEWWNAGCPEWKKK